MFILYFLVVCLVENLFKFDFINGDGGNLIDCLGLMFLFFVNIMEKFLFIRVGNMVFDNNFLGNYNGFS